MFQESLVGNSKTVMIAAISPAQSNLDETISTLRFAQSVKLIKTSAVKNTEMENSGNMGAMKEVRAPPSSFFDFRKF